MAGSDRQDEGSRRQAARDGIVATASFGVGAVVCAIAAAQYGLPWLLLVAAFAAGCGVVSGVRAARRSGGR